MISKMDTTKKCFKYFDGAAKLTIKNMHTSEMKELVEILTKEIKFREDIGKEIEDARTQTLDYSGRGESPNYE
jgi:hypothetical protein